MTRQPALCDLGDKTDFGMVSSLCFKLTVVLVAENALEGTFVLDIKRVRDRVVTM